MPDPNQFRIDGRFGAPVGWLEHEVIAWVHNRVRANTRMPALPPPPIPAEPKIIRWPKVHELTSLERWTAWDLERRGIFPNRVLLTAPAEEPQP
jgi:predicted DNA-binding transcriptional regulator AlpA